MEAEEIRWLLSPFLPKGPLIFIFSWEGLRQLLSGAHPCCDHDWILDLSPLPASPRGSKDRHKQVLYPTA